MNKEEKVILGKNEINNGGYQVIEVNMSDTNENLYAVCTPVKLSQPIPNKTISYVGIHTGDGFLMLFFII